MKALLLIGPSGVGKSTMAQAVGALWSGRGHPTAVIDTDGLAQFGPKPELRRQGELSFHDRLKITNLEPVWQTFRDAGAEFVVVSASPRSPAMAEALAAALGLSPTVVELVADAGTVVARRSSRNGRPSEHPESHRSAGPVSIADVLREFEQIAALGITHARVRNEGPTAGVAEEIVKAVGWT